MKNALMDKYLAPYFGLKSTPAVCTLREITVFRKKHGIYANLGQKASILLAERGFAGNRPWAEGNGKRKGRTKENEVNENSIVAGGHKTSFFFKKIVLVGVNRSKGSFHEALASLSGQKQKPRFHSKWQELLRKVPSLFPNPWLRQYSFYFKFFVKKLKSRRRYLPLAEPWLCQHHAEGIKKRARARTEVFSLSFLSKNLRAEGDTEAVSRATRWQVNSVLWPQSSNQRYLIFDKPRSFQISIKNGGSA